MRDCSIVYPGDPRPGSPSFLAGEVFGLHCIPKKVNKMGRHHGCANVLGRRVHSVIQALCLNIGGWGQLDAQAGPWGHVRMCSLMLVSAQLYLGHLWLLKQLE